jgi:hypothetical protein
MNGHSAFSLAQRYGVSSQPDFSAIDGMQQHAGPYSGGSGLQSGNRSSTSFVFESKALSPDKPLALSSDTGTSLLGARSSMGRMPGMEV